MGWHGEGVNVHVTELPEQHQVPGSAVVVAEGSSELDLGG